MRYFVTLGSEIIEAELHDDGEGRYRITCNGRAHEVRIEGPPPSDTARPSVVVDGKVVDLSPDVGTGHIHLRGTTQPFAVSRQDPRLDATSAQRAHASEVRSPMPGKVVEVRFGAGAPVEKGQCVVVVEAMKMQNELVAPCDGAIRRVHVREGQAVERGTLLVELEASS